MLPEFFIRITPLLLMGAGLALLLLINETGHYIHPGANRALDLMSWLVLLNYSSTGVVLTYLLFYTPLAVKKVWSTAALLACFMVCCPGLSGADTKITPVEEAIQDLLLAQKLAGAVFTVVSGDSVSTYAVGKSNLTTGEPMSREHKVHVGSITKTMLALGALRLAKENRLDLDAPILDILPDLPLANPWAATHPVTIRHLLDHTAGFSDLRLWHFFSSGAQPNTPLTEFYTRTPKVLQVYARPGSLFSYSNIGYALLGLVIEEVVQQPYELYLDEYLLRPIGMRESTFQFTAQHGPYQVANLAMGHFDDGSEAPALPIYLRPAAQFTTTAKDMGVLLKFLLNRGKAGQEVIIDSTHIAAFGRPTYTIAYQGGLHNGYCYGLSLRDRHGVVGLAHSGNIIGYKAMLYLFPDDQKGFFISLNMDSESADYEVFYKTLIEHLQIPSQKVSRPDGVPLGAFEKWSGYYVPVITKVVPLRLLDVLGSFLHIGTAERGIIIAPFQRTSAQAVHLGSGLFRADGRVSASHLLYEEAGSLYFTNGLITYQKISGWRIFVTAVSVASGIVGILILLIAGAGQLFSRPARLLATPLVWVFFNLLLLLLAGVLIGTRNIIYVGDQNWGSLSLFVGSALLPFSVLLSAVLYLKQNTRVLRKFGFWGLLLLAQLVITLLWYGILPFSTFW